MDRANQLYITGLELTCKASRPFPVPINHRIGNIVGPTMQIGDLMKYENIRTRPKQAYNSTPAITAVDKAR